MPAAKRAAPHADPKPAESSIVADLVREAETAAADLVGETKAQHHFDVAFVHALAGAKDEAEAALRAAEDEIERYGLAAYAYQERGFALLKARVHAALGK